MKRLRSQVFNPCDDDDVRLETLCTAVEGVPQWLELRIAHFEQLLVTGNVCQAHEAVSKTIVAGLKDSATVRAAVPLAALDLRRFTPAGNVPSQQDIAALKKFYFRDPTEDGFVASFPHEVCHMLAQTWVDI